MGIITYWLVGLCIGLLTVAALYDRWQQRRVRQSLPPGFSRAERRQALHAERVRAAHQQDVAQRPPPMTDYVVPPDIGAGGGI